MAGLDLMRRQRQFDVEDMTLIGTTTAEIGEIQREEVIPALNDLKEQNGAAREDIDRLREQQQEDRERQQEDRDNLAFVGNEVAISGDRISGLEGQVAKMQCEMDELKKQNKEVSCFLRIICSAII